MVDHRTHQHILIPLRTFQRTSSFHCIVKLSVDLYVTNKPNLNLI